jgi:hypothetical protein
MGHPGSEHNLKFNTTVKPKAKFPALNIPYLFLDIGSSAPIIPPLAQ